MSNCSDLSANWLGEDFVVGSPPTRSREDQSSRLSTRTRTFSDCFDVELSNEKSLHCYRRSIVVYSKTDRP